MIRFVERRTKREKGGHVADRKPFIGDIKQDNELNSLLETSRAKKVTEEDLREQRISFAYGNAPANAKSITKDSVRKASQHILLKA
jgi:hypothetical protein